MSSAPARGATARSRGLIVREFAAEDDRKITVIFDPRIPENEESALTLREKLEAEQQGKSPIVSARFERAVKLVSSLMSHFAEQQAEVRRIVSDALTGTKKTRVRRWLDLSSLARGSRI